MASKINQINTLFKLRNISSFNRQFTATKIVYTKSPGSSSSSAYNNVDPNVPGLSSNVIIGLDNQPKGPGATKESENYKNPEYFCYDKSSYFEAEVEMLKYRCPQPSNKKAN